jgi:hypothetical protein
VRSSTVVEASSHAFSKLCVGHMKALRRVTRPPSKILRGKAVRRLAKGNAQILLTTPPRDRGACGGAAQWHQTDRHAAE